MEFLCGLTRNQNASNQNTKIFKEFSTLVCTCIMWYMLCNNAKKSEWVLKIKYLINVYKMTVIMINSQIIKIWVGSLKVDGGSNGKETRN